MHVGRRRAAGTTSATVCKRGPRALRHDGRHERCATCGLDGGAVGVVGAEPRLLCGSRRAGAVGGLVRRRLGLPGRRLATTSHSAAAAGPRCVGCWLCGRASCCIGCSNHTGRSWWPSHCRSSLRRRRRLAARGSRRLSHRHQRRAGHRLDVRGAVLRVLGRRLRAGSPHTSGGRGWHGRTTATARAGHDLATPAHSHPSGRRTGAPATTTARRRRLLRRHRLWRRGRGGGGGGHGLREPRPGFRDGRHGRPRAGMLLCSDRRAQRLAAGVHSHTRRRRGGPLAAVHRPSQLRDRRVGGRVGEQRTLGVGSSRARGRRVAGSRRSVRRRAVDGAVRRRRHRRRLLCLLLCLLLLGRPRRRMTTHRFPRRLGHGHRHALSSAPAMASLARRLRLLRAPSVPRPASGGALTSRAAGAAS